MTTDQNYQQIYRVGGMLDAGFVGQITYTISLDQVYDELDIHFSFDKRLYSESDVTPELIDRLQTLCTAKYNAPTYPVEEFRQTILHEMKTEIHTMAELNDDFIGCIHRQLTVGIVNGQRDTCKAGGLAGAGSQEDDILHLLSAQAAGGLLAEHPAHRIANIALSTAVRPYNAGNTVVELQNGFVGKRLKSLHFNGFEIHNSPTLFFWQELHRMPLPVLPLFSFCPFRYRALSFRR